MAERGYIVELISHGPYVKATAMDPRTLTEVSIVGDAGRGDDVLRHLAVQKLEYVLRRNGVAVPSAGARTTRARGSRWQPRGRR